MELLSALLKDYGVWGLILIVVLFVIFKSNIKIEFSFPDSKSELKNNDN